MNVEKVKKFSVENAGRIANATFDLALGAYCIGMTKAIFKAGLENAGTGVLVVAGLVALAKSSVQLGLITGSYFESKE